jgi:hypothetical protein
VERKGPPGMKAIEGAEDCYLAEETEIEARERERSHRTKKNTMPSTQNEDLKGKRKRWGWILGWVKGWECYKRNEGKRKNVFKGKEKSEVQKRIK